MINKKKIKEVNDNGFTIVRGLLNKKDINKLTQHQINTYFNYK